MRLTDEQLLKVEYLKGFEVGKQEERARIAAWGLDLCPHEIDTLPRFLRRECPLCWKTLLASKEV